MSEEEYAEVELTEEAKAELAKIDWGAEEETPDDQPPGEGESAAEYEEEQPKTEGEEEPPQGDEVEYELPDGRKIKAAELEELLTAEKRFKDTQAAFTTARQENVRLQQELLARQMDMPRFEPEPPFMPQMPQQTGQEEMQYATETERQLAQRLADIEKRQAIRDHEMRVAAQRENQRRAEEIVSSFRAKHQNLSDDEVGVVLERANRANTFDLDLVYSGMRDYNSEIEAAKKAAIEEYQQNLKAKRKANLESSDGGVKPPEKIDPRTLTEEQQHDLMVQRLKGFQGG